MVSPNHIEPAIALVEEELTHAVIGGFYAVFNRLGHGFLENVYVGALHHELQKRGLHVEREVPVAVYYDGIIVGTFRVDLLVEHRLVLEVKTAAPGGDDLKQLVNYLRATDLELGLLLCFGAKPVVKRGIFRNALKEHVRSGSRLDSTSARLFHTEETGLSGN